MKYLIAFLLILSVGCIFTGYVMDFENSQKLIGFGVLGLFFLVFPLFAYHRWKDKDVKDYMLTKENLDKMRKREGDTRR
jgi:membrane protein YdbS with pleckstrin-like domain